MAAFSPVTLVALLCMLPALHCFSIKLTGKGALLGTTNTLGTRCSTAILTNRLNLPVNLQSCPDILQAKSSVLFIDSGTSTTQLYTLKDIDENDRDDEDDDDGWGELKSLQNERTSKNNIPNTASNSKNVSQQSGQERDLFIPIFALVSLTGLFGAYGYEILRLYSRGELYLPWNN